MAARKRAPAKRVARVPGGGLSRLSAPWRGAYIAKATRNAGPDDLFVRVGRARDDRANLVVARYDSAFLMLNRYPYNPGHLMAAPLRKVAQFKDLSLEEGLDLLAMIALAERALERAYDPDGVNYGVNVGRVAGAGVKGHLHVHLVPRWNGDTNFMPVLGETKVLPESLAQTWTRLRRAIAELAGAARGGRPGARRRGA